MPASPAAPLRARTAAPRVSRVRAGVGLPDVLALAVIGLVLVVLPLVSVPQALDIREPARRLTIVVALALTVVLGRVERREGDRPEPRMPREVCAAVVAVVAVLALATAASGNPVVSVLGRYPRYEGLLTIVGGYLGMLWVGARVLTVERWRDAALAALSATSVWLALMAVRDWVATGAALGRATTPLGNATTVGVWGVIALSLLGWHAWYHRRWWLALGAVAGFVLVLLSASRGGIAGVVAGAVTGAAVALAHRGPRWVWPFVGVVLALFAAAAAFPSTRYRLFGGDAGAETNVSIRLTMWRETVHLVADHPLLGVGPSRWISEQPRYRTPEHWGTMLGRLPLDGTHNLVLQVLSVAGVLGLLATLALGAVVVRALARDHGPDRTGLRAQKAGVLCALLGTAGALMFAFTEPVFVAPLMMLVGGSVATRADDATRHPSPLTDRAARVMRPVVALVSVVALMGSTLALGSEVRLRQALTSPPGPAMASPMTTALQARPWDADSRLRPGYHLIVRATYAPQWRAISRSSPYLDSACPRLRDDPGCLMLQARARSNDSRFAEALQAADAGLALAPDDPELMRERARALAYLGRSGEAYGQAEQLIRRYPTYALSWETRARVQALAGHPDAAAASMSAADRCLLADPTQVRRMPLW